MKTKIINYLLISMFLFVCGQKENTTNEKTASSPIDSVKLAIEKAWAVHVAADMAGDPVTATSIYDNEAFHIEYGAPMIVGKTAIDNGEVEILNSMKVIKLGHTIEGLTLEKDHAFQLGLVEGTFIMNPDTSKVDISTRYMASWKKQADGSWKVHYFVYYP
jgi:ketosteroid isomerase-like protein